MGFKLSRLAVSVVMALPIASAVQAAEKTDDFYIEIKGPAETNHPIQSVTPEPKVVQPSTRRTTETRFAEPYRPDTDLDRFNITKNTKIYGPVRKTDTLWSIANAVKKAHPEVNVTTNRVMQVFMRKNRQAFLNASYGSLLAGSYLKVPTPEELLAHEVVTQETARKTAPAPEAVKTTVPATENHHTETATTGQHAAAETTAADVKQTVVAHGTAEKTVTPATSTPEATTTAQTGADKTDPTIKHDLLSGTRDVPAANTAAKPAQATAHEPAVVDEKVKQLVHADSASAANQPEGKDSSAVAETAEAPADLNAALAEKEKLTQALRAKANAAESENQALKEQLDALNAQIVALQTKAQNEAQLKQQLEDTQAKLKELEAAKQAVHEAEKTPEAATKPEVKEGGFLHEIISTPLNLLLILFIPVLAILVVVSFWLRARAKKDLAEREQEMAENTALMMDEGEDQFGDLLSGEMNKENLAVPDLNLADEMENVAPVESVEPAEGTESTEMSSEEAMPDLSFHDESFDESDNMSAPIEVEPQIATESSPIPPMNALPDEVELDFPEIQTEPLASVEPAGVHPPKEPELISEGDLMSLFEGDDNPAEKVKPKLDLDKMQAAESSNNETAASEDPLLDQLNLDKLMSDKGLQMSDQVISEPEGWEVTPDEEPHVELKQQDITLQEVNNESDKEWLKQFESEQAESDGADYRSIDDLLAEAEHQENAEESLEADLDVGLDQYPDMIPEHEDVDIDEDGGVGAQLDLARAYLEIDDKDSAKELLLEVQAKGNDVQVKEATKLLSKIG